VRLRLRRRYSPHRDFTTGMLSEEVEKMSGYVSLRMNAAKCKVLVSECWTVSKTLAQRLDAFDTWCLRKILRIPYTRRTTNDTVRSITGCLPVSEKVKSFRLRIFGHLARSAPEEDHHRVIAAALRPPPDWRRPPGRLRSTWLRVIDEDVRPQNFGVHTAWRKAKERDTWHQVVSTATLC